MAFTTSFLSSITIATTLCYFALLQHQRTRLEQATIIRSCAQNLDALVDPQLAAHLATIKDENYSGGMREYRIVRQGGLERFKDGWNRELEHGIRWVHDIELGRVREALEARYRQWKGGERRV